MSGYVTSGEMLRAQGEQVWEGIGGKLDERGVRQPGR